MTFIVGKSGSGKSTLGNLLMKYYKPTSGDILIDGHPIQTLDAEWLRQNVTLVPQQSALFNETVYQIIAFGREGHATVEDVLNASKTGDLQQTITDLPEGLSTLVGSNREPLSGGQQQRIAIARARLRDTPILILDEAICALDQMSKQKAMEEIRKWREKKTTIVITHDALKFMMMNTSMFSIMAIWSKKATAGTLLKRSTELLFLSIPFMLEVIRQFSNRDENQSQHLQLAFLWVTSTRFWEFVGTDLPINLVCTNLAHNLRISTAISKEIEIYPRVFRHSPPMN
jgi:ABC-type transport system involved in cytochrome bd biosynthesis fused ATPase/permease subunit